MTKFDKTYWDTKYRNNKTGWDIGYISTPIKTYIDQISEKNKSILIPGGGNSYEAEYLHKNGFKNVSVIDIAKQPLINLHNRFPSFHEKDLIHANFFDHQNKYDLIIEQTFFCALDPTLREEYVNKMYDLLNDGGKLVGLLFDFELTNEGPPFGGNIIEYIQLFYAKFEVRILERCYNSIKPRDGRELFFIFVKK
ncbi:Thiopurine S-methyltransferase (TPMT) [Lutibacter oricola]|uniref:Thiopurine S-methyltransferase (TPMT) n=1 Tax=Lutibacter oricola TaxID=762486 RepID=A0A1H2XLZ3_9FLAO|nr:methyltransferase domain-containing protein [Lutibacter oricola]SDW93865.1 Thiopurine S-methyltransferase (TPMT) [Lutibacter oricola]